MSGYRRERIADLILGYLGRRLHQLGDPRLTLVTLTGVDVTPDLKIAWVHWSAITLGKPGAPENPVEAGCRFLSEEEVSKISEALRGASPLLQRELGKELKLRYTPRIMFRYDESGQRGARIDELLQSISKSTHHA